MKKFLSILILSTILSCGEEPLPPTSDKLNNGFYFDEKSGTYKPDSTSNIDSVHLQNIKK